jgi:membrane-associated phospholipid phosphatase
MPTKLRRSPGQQYLVVDEPETPAAKPPPGRRVNAWLPAGLAFGALAASFVSAGWLGNLDRSIVMALNHEIFGRSALADHVLEQLPFSIAAAPLMMCGVWWLLARERDPARWSRLVVGLLAVVATAGISLALQHSFLPFSARPFMTMNLVTSEALSGLRQHSGFPSDYSGFVVAIATCIAFNNRRMGVVAFAWAFALCLLRIAEGAHFVVQTAAGCALGFSIAAATQSAPLPQWAGKLRAQPWVWALCFLLSYECATAFYDAQWAIRLISRSSNSSVSLSKRSNHVEP